MLPKEIDTLNDMSAFILLSIKHDARFDYILSNIAHDCIGLLERQRCFVPRTSGYTKVLELERTPRSEQP